MSAENAEPEHGSPEWLAQQMVLWTNRETTNRNQAVAELKAAIPFFAHLGITAITMSYNGEGDSGDIDDIEIRGPETAPRTETALDEALKTFPPETNAYERFHVDTLKDHVFTLLPAGFEINEGSFGQVIIDCVNNKIRLENNERVMEINSSEQEW